MGAFNSYGVRRTNTFSSMIRNYLKAGINRTLDDTRRKEITRATVEGYGEGKWNEIMAALYEWENKGYLAILRDPREVQSNDVCVLMRSYIERESPWPDWP